MISWFTGDVFDGLATLADGSIDLVVTSPPFLALRSYLPADHPDKVKEIGSEATPAEFLDVMLRVTAELRRVLAPHGSIAVELGDTYAGSSQEQRQAVAIGSARWGGENGQPTLTGARGGTVDRHGDGWPFAKSKTLIPELYRIALAYGFNPLTGEPSPAGRWRVRNVVTWCRPNPPVGALGDKWRPATSDVVVACTSGKRYWDDLATRREHLRWPREPETGMRKGGMEASGWAGNDVDRKLGEPMNSGGNPSGAPLLDYWEIPPTGYAGAHYAVYPPALVVPLVKAMVPQRVCRECGEPSRRITENGAVYDRDLELHRSVQRNDRNGAGRMTVPGSTIRGAELSTVGFTDCGHGSIVCRSCNEPHEAGGNGDLPELRDGVPHPLDGYVCPCGSTDFKYVADHWRPGRVLDPFAGSGTTLLVAHGHGFDAVGFDLDERNLELARERVGPMFFQELV